MVRQHPNDPISHSSHSLGNKLLRLLLILLVFFSLLSLILVNLVGQDLSYEKNKALVLAQTQQIAADFSQHVNRIENVMSRLTLLASAIDPQQYLTQLKPLLARKNSDINVLSAYVMPIADGPALALKLNHFADNSQPDMTNQYKRQSWFLYARGLPQGAVYWSAPVAVENTNILKVLVASPYAVDGNTAGVIVLQVQLSALLLQSGESELTSYALLLDAQNRPYFSAGLQQALALDSMTITRITEHLGPLLTQEAFVHAGRHIAALPEAIVATGIVEPKTQWKTLTIAPQRLLTQGLFAYQSTFLFSAVGLILLSLVVAWYVIKRQLFAPMRQLDNDFTDKQLSLSKDIIASPYKETNTLVAMLNTSLDLLQQKQRVDENGITSDKRRLIEGINNEIKTPINTILSSVALLKKSNLTTQDKEYIALIAKSAKMSMTVIDNVTNYSKIISGDLVLQQTRFDLFALLDQVYTSLRTKLSGNLRVRFSLSYPEHGHRFFYGDPEHLQQVLIDLVSNALKFTSRGFVELKVESTRQQVANTQVANQVDCEELVFAITDTGIGMPQSKIDMLLEPPSIARYEPINFHKPGLTLSICHRLILLMDGKLSAESVLGEGTTFTVKLALPRAEQLGQQQLISSNAVAVDKLANLKVLLIDDNKINQVLAQKIFNVLHMQPYIGANMADAQQLLKTNDIDIIYLRSSELARQSQLLTNICEQQNRAVPIVGLLEAQKHFDCSDTPLTGLLNMPLTRQALIEETVRVLGFQSPLADVLHPLNKKVD